MLPKDPRVHIMHIRDARRRIGEYALEGGPDWTSKPVVMDAICRNITIIGEAASKLGREFHQAHPEIRWPGIVGARNIVMHESDYLKPEWIRRMAEKDIPALLANCLRLLDES